MWLTNLFTGSNRLEKALSLATQVGASERRLMTLTSLARAAEAEKITTGIRYGLNLYGSARTEAAVEARDGYRQIKEELIKAYKGVKEVGAVYDKQIKTEISKEKGLRIGSTYYSPEELLNVNDIGKYAKWIKYRGADGPTEKLTVS